MLASITERIREIGVRRAVGAKSRDIFVQIVVESVVIGFIGGLLGLIASVGIMRILVAHLAHAKPARRRAGQRAHLASASRCSSAC